MPALWTTLLEYVSAARSRKAEAGGNGASVVTISDTLVYQFDDEVDDDFDDDDEFDDDDRDGDDDDEEEDDDDEEEETWQVSGE